MTIRSIREATVEAELETTVGSALAGAEPAPRAANCSGRDAVVARYRKLGYTVGRRGLDLGDALQEVHELARDLPILPVDVSTLVRVYEALLTGYREGTVDRVRRISSQLHYLQARLLSAQEEERRRIARELHDEAGQLLATTAYQLDLWMDRVAAESQAAAAALKDVRTRLVECAERLHQLSADLRPAMLETHGLLPTVAWLVRRSARQGSVSVSLRSQQPLHGLPPEVETAAFRIVQEAVTNAIRHSRAEAACVRVERRGQNLVVAIADNGVGMGGERAVAEDETLHLGLVGMRERAQLLGGLLRIFSVAGRGTLVYLRVPLPAEDGT